jgi:glycerophosphoryl diester phosphodiesterase
MISNTAQSAGVIVTRMMNMPKAFLTAIILLSLVLTHAGLGAAAVRGHIRDVSAESVRKAQARHEMIAARRAGPIIIVHRGASAFAPENTLEAYAAAMDYGADGCEVDIRRTADGVLVLFHDEMLDRLTEGFGPINQLAYGELLRLQPRLIYGTANHQTRVPTFAALLVLARQRAILLHLDIKEPDLEAEIIRLLDAADAWDHVVAVNDYNAARILRHPKLQLLRYKTSGLFEGRRDLDPETVKAALVQPGEMLIVDDPRVAAQELKREPYRPMPLPKNIRRVEPTAGPGAARDTNHFNAMALVSAFDRRTSHQAARGAEWAAILEADFPERNQLDGDAAYQRQRTERIFERAWAAQRLGGDAYQAARVEKLLEQQVIRRSLHREWIYHGLDGAMAARALAARGATGSAPVLIEAFRRIDPELKKLDNPQWAQYPLAWADFHFKMHLLPALGGLRCDASKRFLQEYVGADAAGVREFGPPMFEEATQALLRQNLARDELTALLKSPNPAVRGTAILACLDRPGRDRTAALKAAAPWALELPRARRN